MTTQSNKYAVPALDKGFDILEYLVDQELPRSQSEIAIALGRSPNEIYRVLVGLEARGYLHRDELSGKYHVSLKLYNLSRRISPVDKVRQCSLPHMEELAFDTGFSCHIAMLYQSQAMVIVNASSHSPVSLTIAEGALFPVTTTGSGLILLANSNKAVQDMLLERDSYYRALPKMERGAFMSRLSKIRTEGYQVEGSQFVQGINEIAVLIGEPEGVVIAALVIVPIQHAQQQPMPQHELVKRLRATADKIARQLGY